MKQLFTLLTFLGILGSSFINAQDLRFSQVVTATSETTSKVDIYIQHLSGTENIAGYTVYYYYDNTETTVTGYDSSPTATGLGWDSNNETSIFFDPIPNIAVSVTHTGYFFYQNIDDNLMGDDISTSPVHLLTINFDHSVGTAAGGEGWLAETAQVVPMQYVGIDFMGHSVIVSGDQHQLLPLELIGFDAKAVDGRHGLLHWATSSEQALSHFEIERSTNGHEWLLVGKEQGKGTDLQQQNYSFLDKNIYTNGQDANTFYYRLKMVDLDGAYEYSAIKTIWFNKKQTTISIYPNPSPGALNFTEKLSGKINIINVVGQIVWQQEQGNGIQNIDLSHLPTGTYLVENVGMNGQIKTAKFIISKK